MGSCEDFNTDYFSKRKMPRLVLQKIFYFLNIPDLVEMSKMNKRCYIQYKADFPFIPTLCKFKKIPPFPFEKVREVEDMNFKPVYNYIKCFSSLIGKMIKDKKITKDDYFKFYFIINYISAKPEHRNYYHKNVDFFKLNQKKSLGINAWLTKKIKSMDFPCLQFPEKISLSSGKKFTETQALYLCPSNFTLQETVKWGGYKHPGTFSLIDYFPPIFSQLTELKELGISYKTIKPILLDMRPCEKLISLYLFKTDLTGVPLANYDNITELNFELNSRLTYVPKCFKQALQSMKKKGVIHSIVRENKFYQYTHKEKDWINWFATTQLERLQVANQVTMPLTKKRKLIIEHQQKLRYEKKKFKHTLNDSN